MLDRCWLSSVSKLEPRYLGFPTHLGLLKITSYFVSLQRVSFSFPLWFAYLSLSLEPPPQSLTNHPLAKEVLPCSCLPVRPTHGVSSSEDNTAFDAGAGRLTERARVYLQQRFRMFTECTLIFTAALGGRFCRFQMQKPRPRKLPDLPQAPPE